MSPIHNTHTNTINMTTDTRSYSTCMYYREHLLLQFIYSWFSPFSRMQNWLFHFRNLNFFSRTYGPLINLSYLRCSLFYSRLHLKLSHLFVIVKNYWKNFRIVQIIKIDEPENNLILCNDVVRSLRILSDWWEKKV